MPLQLGSGFLQGQRKELTGNFKNWIGGNGTCNIVFKIIPRRLIIVRVRFLINPIGKRR